LKNLDDLNALSWRWWGGEVSRKRRRDDLHGILGRK
jgi:hypothetical protein